MSEIECCPECGKPRDPWPAATRKAMLPVFLERLRQLEKWGDQRHDTMTWLAILSEEVGEAAKAALHDVYGGKHAGEFLDEIIQVTAVGLQIIENEQAGTCIQPFRGTVGKGDEPADVAPVESPR